MSAAPGPAGAPAGEGPPPVGGRWGVLYAAVVAALAAEIALLAWLTEAFR